MYCRRVRRAIVRVLILRCTEPLLHDRLALKLHRGLIRNNIGDNGFNLSRGRYWPSVGLSTKRETVGWRLKKLREYRYGEYYSFAEIKWILRSISENNLIIVLIERSEAEIYFAKYDILKYHIHFITRKTCFI